MKKKKTGMVGWFLAVWTEANDESVRAYRRHVRGLFIGWALTALAMALIETYPNEQHLSMYDVLLTQGLPWQQQWLAAIELAAPLVMVWHVIGLRIWGAKRFIQP